MTLAAIQTTPRHSSCEDGILHCADPLPLTHGEALVGARLAYRIEGPAKAPVVLALGGISAHRRVAGENGWWSKLAGCGRAIDLDRVRVLSFDWLGGSGDSTPAMSAEFPRIDTLDQASAIVRLLDHLAIDCLAAGIGASYGGLVVQQLLRHHPERVASGLIIGAAHRPHPMATAWRCVQRRIILDGIRDGRTAAAVSLARQLAMTTYRSQEEFAERFDAPPRIGKAEVSYAVQDYLDHCGRRFEQSFLPWAYLRLSESIDLHRLDPERIQRPFELIGFDTDQLAPPADLSIFHELAPSCRWLEILPSHYGHDGFLKEHWRLAPLLQRAVPVDFD